MGRIARTTAAGLLVLALGACTGGVPEPLAQAPAVSAGDQDAVAAVPAASAPGGPVAARAGADVGNGRPASSHDGLMVHRRIVIAVHPAEGADPGELRRWLDGAAAAKGLGLTDISPTVLDAVILEHIVPEVIAALPPGSSRDDAESLSEIAYGPAGSDPWVEHVHVGEAIVHDLQFTLAADDPAALAESIAAEGILSDALGNYEESLEGGALTIGYTGPLLSDALVESVRDAMARSAGKDPGEVGLAARSTSGDGVDLSREPVPEEVDDSGHDRAGNEDSGNDASGH